MKFIGKQNEYLEAVEITESNCSILKNCGSSELSLLWFTSDNNKLTIDASQCTFNTNDIISLYNMKKHLHLILIFLFLTNYSFAQKNPESTELWEPVPTKVEPGEFGQPPSDAIVLFDGKDLSNFISTDGTKALWNISNGSFTVNTKAKSIKTKQKFGDCQLHIEWRAPIGDEDSGQGKGNSGVFLMERYEVQVLDSYENTTYSNGQAASLYKQYIPMVNASKKTGEWQYYDIVFIAPRFSESGNVISPAKITVFHNGILVHHNVSLIGSTEFIGMPRYKQHEAKEAIMLQNHTDLVSFRNIWIREL